MEVHWRKVQGADGFSLAELLGWSISEMQCTSFPGGTPITGDSFLWRMPLLGSLVDMASWHWHGMALCESAPCWPPDSISGSFPLNHFHKTEPCVVFLLPTAGLPQGVWSVSGLHQGFCDLSTQASSLTR